MCLTSESGGIAADDDAGDGDGDGGDGPDDDCYY